MTLTDMAYAVSLHPTAPESLRALLAEYLQASESGSHYFYSLTVVQGQYFVEFEAVKNRADNAPWKVLIPSGFVLAITALDGGSRGIGFQYFDKGSS